MSECRRCKGKGWITFFWSQDETETIRCVCNGGSSKEYETTKEAFDKDAIESALW